MKAANQTGADSANEFAVQTFARMLRDDPDGNWVYSPASLWFVMGMAVIGARGRTLSEMMAAMSLDDIGPLISARAEMLGASSVRMGNMLLCHDGYRLRPEFVEACESRMGAVAWARDFRDPGTVPEVNAWISEMTAGKITQLLGGLSENLRLVLINAIYFKSSWMEPFKDAVQKDFKHPAGTSPCWMMKREKDDIQYCEAANYRAVKLPYSDRRSSMVLILPNEGHTPASVVGQLTVSGWSSLMGAMRTNEVEVQLPRFRVERTMERELMKALYDMGVREAFSIESSDFSGMDPADMLYVQSIVQKAIVEVDEQGTEAAAATAMMFAMRSISLGPTQIVFDRPFVYAIVDDVTGLVTFIGTVDRP